MSKPKRPVTIWIAIAMLAVVGTTFLLPFAYGILTLVGSAIPGQGSGIIIRASVLLPPALGCLLSVIPILWRKSWGRWLALSSLAAFAFEYWAFEVFVSSQWNTVSSVTEGIGYGLAMSIPTVPVLVVGALLIIGKRTSDYFSTPAESDLQLEPPLPPVFGGRY